MVEAELRVLQRPWLEWIDDRLDIVGQFLWTNSKGSPDPARAGKRLNESPHVIAGPYTPAFRDNSTNDLFERLRGTRGDRASRPV